MFHCLCADKKGKRKQQDGKPGTENVWHKESPMKRLNSDNQDWSNKLQEVQLCVHTDLRHDVLTSQQTLHEKPGQS